MTTQELIKDLCSRINPGYAHQLGTESYERRLCVEALEAMKAEIDRLRKDAERYRWLAKEHGWWLLHHFPAVRPYLDANEVIDESIDSAMSEEEGDGG